MVAGHVQINQTNIEWVSKVPSAVKKACKSKELVGCSTGLVESALLFLDPRFTPISHYRYCPEPPLNTEEVCQPRESTNVSDRSVHHLDSNTSRMWFLK